ncbi:MAG: hypothetical protein M3R63_13155 [Actinomycetota bacterium]|nr:hypothetical protein [Actinomycetota bacterium]
MTQAVARTDQMADTLARILTAREPFGPRDAESLIDAGLAGSDQLFDRSNLIYAQTCAASRPTYIIGRKGAGKTAFLRGSPVQGEPAQEVLRTATVYAEMVAVLHHYRATRSPLFVPQVADIWLAMFEHVALYHACDTATSDDPPNELQVLWDYLAAVPDCPSDATAMAERFLAELQGRIDDPTVHGLRELIEGLTRGGISFARVRPALRTVLARRPRPVMIVMDNLEDLHARVFELEQVLAGLFHSVGLVINKNPGNRPFGLQLCLPSELWDQVHRISANPEKDFGGNYLTIYWTARELLHLAGTRYRLFMQTHHPHQLEALRCRISGTGEPDVALLRAALPPLIRNGLGIDEDPVAYLLRHTQLLPRHLIEILNSVFTAPMPDSVPWAVTEDAVRVGTRTGEKMIVEGVFAAHRASFPFAPEALKRLANRLRVCFAARELRTVFNREGVTKVTGGDFDDFVGMLLTLGVLGVKVDETARYNKVHFQYTFDSTLNVQEDVDDLCFHPLFTRYLFERSFDRLRQEGERPTYPYGCDPADDDYRVRLGYADRRRRG